MDDVAEFLKAVGPARRHREAAELDGFFRRVTGYEPVLWPGNILGYGAYNYAYKSGRTGRCFATGFSPRKAKLSIYIVPGYADFSEILNRLGKHKMGKSCLYLNKLPDVDMDVLAELVQAGLADLARVTAP
ncbi:MAG: DUF1801 domain-containing protein [Sulfitobacter sp.]